VIRDILDQRILQQQDCNRPLDVRVNDLKQRLLDEGLTIRANRYPTMRKVHVGYKGYETQIVVTNNGYLLQGTYYPTINEVIAALPEAMVP
jgi:hypothetical protein